MVDVTGQPGWFQYPEKKAIENWMYMFAVSQLVSSSGLDY
jgi:hypothetical protein